ncbi:MAG: DNA methylase [Candidatus Wallbacteria bacterium HGW-Wallbacteria-1]|uniref:DNA methylase n=1 Tax=Candidatus Wallbacteria bacterium HGW-Wallbacteria-1 TaxID=2013854 RepID=A0A2N1PK19_9BACT|nr:MAG: DNA methylase [Candidatus Wallbacteria bacterium HGW-Wallbacteria-1]
MKNYAILANPGYNRVYFEASKKLSISELSIGLSSMSCKCMDIREHYIAGIFYIAFRTEDELSEADISILSRLSFVYAMFEIIVFHQAEDKTEYLRPIPKPDFRYMDTNISGILKYPGKTNEIFTRLMINVGLFSSRFIHDEIRLLDPVAGKGTTLFEGLICGYNVYGVEIGDKVVNESYHFMKKYLETARYKHVTRVEKISGDKSLATSRFIIDIARNKKEMKENNIRHFEIISGNSAFTDKLFRKNYFNLIVGDLPYGVQHGNVTNQKQSSLTRNPAELLSACLNGWYHVLMPDGVLVLAWNTFVLPRDRFTELLQDAGFSVFNDGVYLEFQHRVDQSINRDIIVAKK